MNRRCPVFSVLFLLTLFAVVGDEAGLVFSRSLLERAAFPENDEMRRLLRDAVLAPAYQAVESPYRIHRQVSDNRYVQFEMRKGMREWYLIFRNQRGEEPRETYPIWGRGAWIIKKDLLSGSFVQAKIFLQDDEESFVRLFPMPDGRSRLDVHLYGRPLSGGVIIPVAFEELMLSPFARIVSLSRHLMDWERIFPNPDAAGYRRVAMMVDSLKPHVDAIVELPDAAVDGGGRSVYIETGQAIPPGAPLGNGRLLLPGQVGLNCSGYVKWVVDGIFSAWAGHPGTLNLDIPSLRRPTSRSSRNAWSESRSAAGGESRAALESLLRDPHFGLDWNRNLAVAVEQARLGRELRDEEQAVLDARALDGIPHRSEMGYFLEDLPAALYQLAADRPGSVYLAAVNSRFLPEPTEANPDPLPLHQYWHVAILAPWFDDGLDGGERGLFRVAVLDTGDVAESLLPRPGFGTEAQFPAAVMARAVQYARLGRDDEGGHLIPEVMVQLVRVDVPRNFVAPPLPG